MAAFDKAASDPRRASLGNPGWVVLLLVSLSPLSWISNPQPEIEPALTPSVHGDAPIRALAFAFSPDGRMIATSHPEGCVEIRDPADMGKVQTMLPLTELAWSMAFSPDGRLLALGGAGPEILLCDLDSRRDRAACDDADRPDHDPGIFPRRSDAGSGERSSQRHHRLGPLDPPAAGDPARPFVPRPEPRLRRMVD